MKIGLIAVGWGLMTLSSWIVYAEVTSGRSLAMGIRRSRETQPIGYAAALVYNGLGIGGGLILLVAGLMV